MKTLGLFSFFLGYLLWVSLTISYVPINYPSLSADAYEVAIASEKLMLQQLDTSSATLPVMFSSFRGTGDQQVNRRNNKDHLTHYALIRTQYDIGIATSLASYANFMQAPYALQRRNIYLMHSSLLI